jgi:hypothetical protein
MGHAHEDPLQSQVCLNGLFVIALHPGWHACPGVQWLQTNCGHHFVKVAATLTFFATAGAGAILSYLYSSFTPHASCARNICFITLTLVMCIVLLVLTYVAVTTHPGGDFHTNVSTLVWKSYHRVHLHVPLLALCSSTWERPNRSLLTTGPRG